MRRRGKVIEAIVAEEFSKDQTEDAAMAAIQKRVAPIKKLYTEYEW
jgi:hypothetical protein